MIEAKTIQRYKAKKMGKLIEEAQMLVNAFVRQRDQINERGDFRCISCGQIKPKSQCNAGHYFSRGNFGSVRFDLDNIHSQCVRCNLHLHGNLIPYRENLIKKIGVERFAQLESLAYIRGYKHDRITIIYLIEKYKKLRKMAIKMSEKLQKVVKELGLKEENILYVNIQRPFLERILSEEKKVEFRDLSEYWLKKINNYDKKDLSCLGSKPIKYILFQNGMKNEGSPRALVELKNAVEKWAKDSKGNPAEVITRDKREDRDSFRYTIEEGKTKYPNIFKEAEYEGFDINDDEDEFLAFELGKIVYREHI